MRYLLSLLVFVIICILSLMPVPETPLSDIRFIDKWTHIVMYLGQSLTICYEYMRQHGLRLSSRLCPHGLRTSELRSSVLWLGGFVLPTLIGILMEILQATCTGGTRSGDWVDALADAFGALLACLFVKAFVRFWR